MVLSSRGVGARGGGEGEESAEGSYLVPNAGFSGSVHPLKVWATWVYGHGLLFWGASRALVRVPEAPETSKRLRSQAGGQDLLQGGSPDAGRRVGGTRVPGFAGCQPGHGPPRGAGREFSLLRSC